MAKGNECSFLRVSKPEIDLPAGTNLYASEVYAKGRENLIKFRDGGWIQEDEEERKEEENKEEEEGDRM